MLPEEIDTAELRAQLARRGLTQLDLARLLGHPVSTFGNWFRGAHPAPADLVARIERALGLAAGTLAKQGRPVSPPRVEVGGAHRRRKRAVP